MVDQSTGLGSVVTHLYRGEVAREISWRERSDSTTNWAVTVIGGVLTYAFSSNEVAHSIILVGMGVGIVFLLIEARRFQQYDVRRSRVRSMQETLFTNALDPYGGVEQRDWRRQLSEASRRPTVKMPLRTALAHRLRRVYLPLLFSLLLVWLVRLNGAGGSLARAAALSNVPGWNVLGVAIVAHLCLVVIASWPGARAVSELDDEVDRGELGGKDRLAHLTSQ